MKPTDDKDDSNKQENFTRNSCGNNRSGLLRRQDKLWTLGRKLTKDREWQSDEETQLSDLGSMERWAIAYLSLPPGSVCYCIWFMVCMVSYIIVYGIYIVCMVYNILTFLTRSPKLGLRADAPIVVQPHWKSICSWRKQNWQRYNQYWSIQRILGPEMFLN